MKLSKGIIIILLLKIVVCTHAQYVDTLAYDQLEVERVESINSSASEFSPFLIKDRIVYVTEGDLDKEKDKKVDERYWDLRTALIMPNGDLIPDEYLPSSINSPYHEGPLSLDSRDSTLYFTRDNYQSGELKKGSEEKVYLQIFKSDRYQGSWTEAKPVDFLDRNFNICHPAIIPEDNLIIFSSNLPNGFGGMDLYKISLDATSIEEAINLGPQVNSSGNEVFPVYHESGNLIFSSDNDKESRKHRNYDLYLSKKSDDFSITERLKFGFSSDQDELGLFVYSDGKSGYFSSSRIGGFGKDDIYYFQSDRSIFLEPTMEAPDDIIETIIEEDIAKKTELKLLFKNADLTNVSGLNLQVYSSPNELLVDEYKNISSSVIISTLNQGEQYKIVVSKDGYYPYYRTVYTTEPFDEILVFLKSIPEPPAVVMYPKPEAVKPKEVIIPIDVGSIVVFENIYYEYNSALIKSGSADELEALIRAMKKNPSMKVRLVAHTDNRGTNEYNLELSKQRAEAAKAIFSKKRNCRNSNIYSGSRRIAN